MAAVVCVNVYVNMDEYVYVGMCGDVDVYVDVDMEVYVVLGVNMDTDGGVWVDGNVCVLIVMWVYMCMCMWYGC